MSWTNIGVLVAHLQTVIISAYKAWEENRLISSLRSRCRTSSSSSKSCPRTPTSSCTASWSTCGCRGRRRRPEYWPASRGWEARWWPATPPSTPSWGASTGPPVRTAWRGSSWTSAGGRKGDSLSCRASVICLFEFQEEETFSEKKCEQCVESSLRLSSKLDPTVNQTLQDKDPVLS